MESALAACRQYIDLPWSAQPKMILHWLLLQTLREERDVWRALSEVETNHANFVLLRD